jgi:hypothetical protein
MASEVVGGAMTAVTAVLKQEAAKKTTKEAANNPISQKLARKAPAKRKVIAESKKAVAIWH